MTEADEYVRGLAALMRDYDVSHGTCEYTAEYDAAHLGPELVYTHRLRGSARITVPLRAGESGMVAHAAAGAGEGSPSMTRFLGPKEIGDLKSHLRPDPVKKTHGLERYTIPLVLRVGNEDNAHATCVWFARPSWDDEGQCTVAVAIFDPSAVFVNSERYVFVNKFLEQQCALLSGATCTFKPKNVMIQRAGRGLPTYDEICAEGLCSFWVVVFMACSFFETAAVTDKQIWACTAKGERETLHKAARAMSSVAYSGEGLEHPAVQSVAWLCTWGLKNALARNEYARPAANHQSRVPKIGFGRKGVIDDRLPLEWQAKAFLELAGAHAPPYVLSVTLGVPHTRATSSTDKLFEFPVVINGVRVAGMVVYMRGYTRAGATASRFVSLTSTPA